MNSCGACMSSMMCRAHGCQRRHERNKQTFVAINRWRHEEKVKREAAILAKVRYGEKFFRHWCQDTSLGCACAPHKFETLDCISIGRGVTAGGVKYDRCLGCDAMWTSRDYRWQTAVSVVDDKEAAA